MYRWHAIVETEGYHHCAFLVRDDNSQFTVLDASLWTHKYKKSDSQEPEQEKVTYKAGDLEKESTKVLQSLEQPEDKETWSRRFGERLTEPAELFVWARFCAAHDKPKLADRLFAQAKRSAEKRNEQAKINRSFHQILADDIAHALMWQAVQDFGEPAVSRKDLLARFDRIIKHFPRSPHSKRAQDTAELLKKMVAEDEAHARKGVKATKEMTKEERIAELIFRLQDQNGQQWSQPGSCDIFALDHFGPERGEKSPAQQLVDIGYDAVPQLIEALDDKRFTRSVGFHRDFYFSHFVLRVGDCAEAVLQRIAGRRFWGPRSTAAAMIKDGQIKEVKERVQEWWNEFQKKGEKQVLIDGVSSGDDNSPEQAERLVKKYPESALGAIRQGVRSANKDWITKSLVNSAAELQGDATTEFLREQLNASALLTRIAAARGLLDRGRDEAVGAMIEEWKKAKKSEHGEDLINFLLWCGKVEAVKALAKELQKRPVNTCLQVIEAIHSPGWSWEKNQKSLAPEVELAIDEILIGELDDSRERTGMSGSWGDKQFSNPRLCDLSGHVLALRWKQPSWFDLSGSQKTRDRQRVELKNVWLKKQGKPPLPLPAPRKIERLSNQRLQPLLQRLEAAVSSAEREAARRELLALGLPALPAVREKLQALKPDDPAYLETKTLASQMALIVEEVHFSKESAPPPENLRKQFEALRGEALVEGQIINLLRTITSGLPPGATGIKLSIDRDGDGTGVTLGVTLTTKRIPQGGTQKGWETFETISVNGRCTHNSSGFSSWEHGVSKENWEEFARHLSKVLESPPEHYFSVRVGMIQGE